jgi:hypothetical protein
VHGGDRLGGVTISRYGTRRVFLTDVDRVKWLDTVKNLDNWVSGLIYKRFFNAKLHKERSVRHV